MRIFGIDPGSERTGFGCVETDGRRHRLVACGAIVAAAGDTFPHRLARIHRELTAQLTTCRPDCVAIENLFHANNARSALKLGHARGVAMLAAIEAGCDIVEYTPAEVKRAVVGYGRAEKQQVQQMITLILGLDKAPKPFDVSDALAVAICHLHAMSPVMKVALKSESKPDLKVEGYRRSPARAYVGKAGAGVPNGALKSWRKYRPPSIG